MSKLPVTTTVLLLISIGATNTSYAQERRTTLAHANDRWISALRRGDAGRLAAMYDGRAWVALPGAPPVNGRAAIVRLLAGLSNRISTINLTSTSIVPLGPNAMVENGTATIRYLTGKGERSSYQVVWRRSDAGSDWKILRDAVTPL